MTIIVPPSLQHMPQEEIEQIIGINRPLSYVRPKVLTSTPTRESLKRNFGDEKVTFVPELISSFQISEGCVLGMGILLGMYCTVHYCTVCVCVCYFMSLLYYTILYYTIQYYRIQYNTLCSYSYSYSYFYLYLYFYLFSLSLSLSGKIGSLRGWIWVDAKVDGKPYIGAMPPVTALAVGKYYTG